MKRIIHGMLLLASIGYMGFYLTVATLSMFAVCKTFDSLIFLILLVVALSYSVIFALVNKDVM